MKKLILLVLGLLFTCNVSFAQEITTDNSPIAFWQEHAVVIIWSIIIVLILFSYIFLLRLQIARNTRKFALIHRQLYESDKLASMGELMKRISHEFNTPLGNSITTASFLAKKTAEIKSAYSDQKLSKNQLESYIDQMEEAGFILNESLIETYDLMSAFKIFSENNDCTENTKFNLEYYLEKLVKTYRPLLITNNHKIILNIEPNLIITGKTQDYYQIFSQLIENAISHGFDEQTDKVIHISVFTNEDQIIIAFTDDGKGIPEEHLKHIFKPLHRINNSDHIVLGLSAVKKAVTDLNGQITCYSEINKGTRFKIIIPKNK